MKFQKLLEKSLKFRGLAGLGLVALTGCGPQAQDFSILGASQASYQGSVANNKVDLLFVIDNSGSMLTKQTNLANGFNSFSNVFTSKGFDFHIGIVTTDTRSSPTGQEGQLQGTPRVITNGASFVTDFQSAVVVGATGSANAKALDAIELSLSPTLLGGYNTGFLRPDAHLAIITLSDADDDDSTASVNDVVNFLTALKPDKFDVLARTYKKNFTVSGVVVQDVNDPECAVMDPSLTFERGASFINLATATNGSIASICKADFSAGLTQISQRIAEAITEIPLATVPDVSTLVITFNDVPVIQDPTNGWSYDSVANKIVFHGSAIPQDNTSIGINYTPNDIIR